MGLWVKRRCRYIAFEVVGQAVKAEVERTTHQIFRGLGEASNQTVSKLIFYDASSQRGLLRCGHMQVERVKAAMAGRRIGGKGATFLIRGVSGTIRSGKRKFLAT